MAEEQPTARPRRTLMHEIRNVVGALDAAASIWKLKRDSLDPKLQSLCDKQHDYVARLAELIDELDGHLKRPAAASAPATDTTPTRPRRILVVDDDPAFCQLVATLLHEHGHTVEIVHDGDQALRRLSQFHPDLALVDLGLPGMNGYELASRLKQQHPTPHLVSLTGDARPQTQRQAIDAGFDQHLVKGDDLSALQGVLSKLPL